MRVLWGGAGGAEVVVSQAREETGLSKVMTGPASGMRLAADSQGVRLNRPTRKRSDSNKEMLAQP